MSACSDNKSKLILILCWCLEVTDALVNSALAHKGKKLSGVAPSIPIPDPLPGGVVLSVGDEICVVDSKSNFVFFY